MPGDVSKAEPSHQLDDAPVEEDAPLDHWTDEQEIALLKALIKYKPVGLSLRLGLRHHSSNGLSDGRHHG